MGAAARRRSARRAAGAGRPARAADGRGTGRALEPLAIPRGDVHGGMEVEAAVLGVERHGALDPRRARVGAYPRGTPPRAIAECRPAEDRCPGEARQCSRLVRERIGVLVGERRPRKPEALEAPPYPGDDAAHVVVRGWRGRMEAQRAVRLAHEDAVEDERVIVEVNVHRPAEALHARHHAGLSAREPLAPRLAAIRAPERTHEDVQHRAAEPVVVGESVAQPVRDREHPLSDGHVGRQHLIDETRRALGHPSSPILR